MTDERIFANMQRTDLTALVAEYHALARDKLEEIGVIIRLLPARSSSSSLATSSGMPQPLDPTAASSPLTGPNGLPLPLELNDELGRLFSAVRSGDQQTAQKLFDDLYLHNVRTAVQLFEQATEPRPRLICSLKLDLARFHYHREQYRETRQILKLVRESFAFEQWYDLATVSNELLAKCQRALGHHAGYLGACARLAVPWSALSAEERAFDQAIYSAEVTAAISSVAAGKQKTGQEVDRRVLPRGDTESLISNGQFELCSKYLREMLDYSKELTHNSSLSMSVCDMSCTILEASRQRSFRIGETPTITILLLSMFSEPVPCDRVSITFIKQVSVGKSRGASMAFTDVPDIELDGHSTTNTNDGVQPQPSHALLPAMRLLTGPVCLQSGWNRLELSAPGPLPHSARGRYACSHISAQFGMLTLNSEVKGGKPGMEVLVSRPSLDVTLNQPTSLVSDITQALQLRLATADDIVSGRLEISSATGLRVFESERLKQGKFNFGSLQAGESLGLDFSVLAQSHEDCTHDISIHTSYTKTTGETFALTNVFQCPFHRLFEVDHHYTPCGAAAGILQVVFRSATTNTVRIDGVALESPTQLSVEPVTPQFPLTLFNGQNLSLTIDIRSAQTLPDDGSDHTALALRLDCSLVVDDQRCDIQPAPFFIEISVPTTQRSAVVDYEISSTPRCGQFTPMKIHVHSLDPSVCTEHEHLIFQVLGSKHYIVSGLTRTRIATAAITSNPGRTFDILLLPLAAGSLPLPQVQLSPVSESDTIIAIDTQIAPSIQVLPVRHFSSAFTLAERG